LGFRGAAIARGAAGYSDEMDYKVFEARILELFFKTGDQITAQLAAYRLGVPVEEARAMLESMTTREIVTMESDDNGVLYFELPSRPPPSGEPLSWRVPPPQVMPAPPSMVPPMMMMIQPVAMVPIQPVAMVPMPLAQEKSMAGAIALSFFFGPLGMLYSTVPGALIMLFAGGLFDILTLGVGVLLTWPGGILWSALATNAHNNRVHQQRNYLQAQQHNYVQQQHARYMASQRALPAGGRPGGR
jgi:hypothetical protein